jgi:hypothetical protein
VKRTTKIVPIDRSGLTSPCLKAGASRPLFGEHTQQSRFAQCATSAIRRSSGTPTNEPVRTIAVNDWDVLPTFDPQIACSSGRVVRHSHITAPGPDPAPPAAHQRASTVQAGYIFSWSAPQLSLRRATRRWPSPRRWFSAASPEPRNRPELRNHAIARETDRLRARTSRAELRR